MTVEMCGRGSLHRSGHLTEGSLDTRTSVDTIFKAPGSSAYCCQSVSTIQQLHNLPEEYSYPGTKGSKQKLDLDSDQSNTVFE